MALAFDAQASAFGLKGGQASVSLTGIATGSLMILFATGNGATTDPIADPAGWTRIARATVGGTPHWIGYRIKVGGDTAVAIAGGASGTANAAVSGYSGSATFGQASTLVSGTTSTTTIDPAAITVAATSLSVVVASSVDAGGATPPSGWTERVDANVSGIILNIEISDKSGLSAGSLDPGVVTFDTSTSDRAAYHIELLAPFSVNPMKMIL